MDFFFLEGNTNYVTCIDYMEKIIRNIEILIWLNILPSYFLLYAKGKLILRNLGLRK